MTSIFTYPDRPGGWDGGIQPAWTCNVYEGKRYQTWGRFLKLICMRTFWCIVVGQPALKSIDITAATIDFGYILVKLGALLGFWQNLIMI